MSMSQEEALRRLDSLIDYGGENIDYGTTQGQAHFIGWRTQVISALVDMVGENDVYTTEFKAHVTSKSGPQLGIGILRRLQSDVEEGYRHSPKAAATP